MELNHQLRVMSATSYRYSTRQENEFGRINDYLHRPSVFSYSVIWCRRTLIVRLSLYFMLTRLYLWLLRLADPSFQRSTLPTYTL